MKSTLLTPFLMAVFLIASTSAAETLINVQTLNHKLEKNNAGWIAKDGWLNHLSKAEAKRMMGLKDTPNADVDFTAPKSLTKASLPTTLDWRNKDGKNWVSPILNQGNCGSCVAFAAIGVMETQLNISSILPGLNTRLSAQNLFACGGGACDYGWYPQAAAGYLMRQGVTDEACMPYVSGASGEDVACEAHCADSNQRTFRISNYSTPSLNVMDVDSVKRALQNGPVVTTLSVYADFMTYAGGVYKHAAGDFLGGHAISIIGYEDATQSYIIRNSWGEDWGEQGFGRVSYTDVSGVGRSTWGFDLPAVGGAVSVMNPRDYSYITGTVDLKSLSTFTNTDALSFAVYDKSNKAIWSSVCQGGDCSASFDSTKLADGRYEVQVLATNAHGDKLGSSARQFFYVVNQQPKLELSYTGKNVDLNKPLSERIEFLISTKSSSVPMNSLEFHFKDAAGKDTTRLANVVLDQMTTGWRTNLVPNGQYEIWMTARVKSNSMETVVETPHATVTVSN
jgi:C1A family cysteine protease